MSSILLSIFCANATSWGVGGHPSGLFLLILREAAAWPSWLEAALKVSLMGVWARDPPELVGLRTPLEPPGLAPMGPFVVADESPDDELGVLEGAGSSIWYWNEQELLKNIIYCHTYRVSHKFSYTWNELFVVNWFISKIFGGNTKWKKVSSPHYLESLMKLSEPGISYSLKRDPRSISEITFYANLRISPIGTEIWYFFKKMLFFIHVSNTLAWMRSVGWLCWMIF